MRRQIYTSLLALGAALLLASAPKRALAMSPRDEPSEDKPTPPVDPEKGERELFSVHFQSTMVTAYHPTFSGPLFGKKQPRRERGIGDGFRLHAVRRSSPVAGGRVSVRP